VANPSADAVSVVFDLGNVLIPWDPRPVYRRIDAGDEAKVDRFLSEVCPTEWNLSLDRGRDWGEAVAERVALFPDEAEAIRAYDLRWEEMLGPPIAGSVAILEELAGRGVPLYALTNWSAVKFGIARARFPFLSLFRDIVVSGEVGLVKPDPAIYRLLLARNALEAASCVFIDDSAANVAAAASLGMRGIRFTDPGNLRRDLAPRLPSGVLSPGI
jgi:2-haloacid dehalogenase